MKKVLGIILLFFIVFFMGVVAHRYCFSSKVSQNKVKKILYWVAPMDPNFRRETPGTSPMGMDLVPVYAGESESGEGTVKISAAVENNLGVKTAFVKRQNISRLITTVGYVRVDENRIEHIHTYIDGWIKQLKVKTTGELVAKGQLLLKLYSPILVNAQEEFILALKNKNSTLIRAGEKKLLTLGMAQNQINQLRYSQKVIRNIKIYATQSGVVSQLNVREGKYVKPDQDIMTLEDLTQIWIIAEVFENQANWVKAGQHASATLPYIPGKTWHGKVDYVYPQLDQKTHTLRVRLVFPNPDLTIKPNMYADIKIASSVIHNALTIPRSALIRTGEGDRVVIALGEGRYRSQAVKIGIESGTEYQILSGLKEDERVVTSAQFLIDSESNLKAAFSRMKSSENKLQSKSELLSQEFIGMGKVKIIDLNKQTLMLDHQPIPSLNMPAMIMEFPVSQHINLGKIKPGDQIHFVMIQQADKSYLITKINVMKKK